MIVSWSTIKRFSSLSERIWPIIHSVLAVAVLLYLFDGNQVAPPIITFFVGLAAVTPLLFWWQGAYRKNSPIQLLNNKQTELEYSSLLLDKKTSELSSLELIQRKRIANKIGLRELLILLWENSKFSIIISLLLITLYSFCSFTQGINSRSTVCSSPQDRSSNEPIQIQNRQALTLHDEGIQITPPPYTKLPIEVVAESQLEIPEGSIISWTVSSSNTTSKAILNSTKIGHRSFSLKNSKFKLSLQLQEDDLWLVSQVDSLGQQAYLGPKRLLIKKDLPAQIKLPDFPKFQELDWFTELPRNVAVEIQDDYGIKSFGYLLIHSRGKGEAVTFKEYTKEFPGGSRKTINQPLELELDSISIAPADQLFLSVYAVDSKQPKAGISRSASYLIEIKDTVPVAKFTSSGLAVDIFPDEFRSQRQLIIDTEKLITKNNDISYDQYLNRSNAIGKEQKVLRLRYGKFLGEEHEAYSDNESNAHSKHTHQEASGEIKQHKHHHELTHSNDGHDDCSSPEHNHNHKDHDGHEGHDHSEHDFEELVKEKQTRNSSHDSHAGHNHSVDPADPRSTTNPIAAYAHFHDNIEEATYFNNEVQTKLREALNLMWKSELQLRLGKPQASLPYQNKALKLIKWIQQDARIYVERVGLDLPTIPIEKKRLSEDLSEIISVNRTDKSAFIDPFKVSRKLVQLGPNDLANLDQKKWQKLAQEWAQATLENPGIDLRILAFLSAKRPSALNRKDLHLLYQLLLSHLPESKQLVTGEKFYFSFDELSKNYQRTRSKRND